MIRDSDKTLGDVLRKAFPEDTIRRMAEQCSCHMCIAGRWAAGVSFHSPKPIDRGG